MLVDIVIHPVCNRTSQLMKLYDSLKSQLSDEMFDVNIIIVNNASTDGLRDSYFHTSSQISYVSSNKKINDTFLLRHAILEQCKSKYVNIITWNCDVGGHYLETLRGYLSNCEKDIILGGVEARKQRRGQIVATEKRTNENLDFPHQCYAENVIFNREMMFKCGILDTYFSLPDAIKFTCYHMSKLYNAKVEVAPNISVILPSLPKRATPGATLTRRLIDYDNRLYVFKDYISKEVNWLTYGPEKDKIYLAPINRLIILPTKQRNDLRKLIKRQAAKNDKIYMTNLPKYMPKRLGYIFQKFPKYEHIIFIHENAQFTYPYFIDDFKIASHGDVSAIFASDNDFSTFELRPLKKALGLSAAFPKDRAWEPNLREVVDWDEFLSKMAELQPDEVIGDLLKPKKPKPAKAEIESVGGKGGPLGPPPVPKQHKKSWYDWMEE